MSRTRLALIALILFWGANFSLVKLAVRDLSPLAFTTLLSLIFRQERTSPMVAAGVGLSVLGIALVVLGGAAGVGFGAGTLRGDLAVLVAAAAWSGYTVGSVPLVHRYGVVPVTAATMWVGTPGLLIVSLPALVRQDWAAVHPLSWLAVLYSGVFAIATAYFLSSSHSPVDRPRDHRNSRPVAAALRFVFPGPYQSSEKLGHSLHVRFPSQNGTVPASLWSA